MSQERSNVLVEGNIQHYSTGFKKIFKDRWVQVIEYYKGGGDSNEKDAVPDSVIMNVMK